MGPNGYSFPLARRIVGWCHGHAIDAGKEIVQENLRLCGLLKTCLYPVLLGTGKRIFAEGTPPRSFELVSTKTLASGVIISTYKVAGPLRIGTMGE